MKRTFILYFGMLEYHPNQLHGSSRRHPHPDLEYMRGSLGSDGWRRRGHWEECWEGGSLSATGYKRGSSPLPTLYLLLHKGVVVVEDARGAVSVIFTGVHWVHLGPSSYLSGEPIKQSKHYPSCNQALHHIASVHISFNPSVSCKPCQSIHQDPA